MKGITGIKPYLSTGRGGDQEINNVEIDLNNEYTLGWMKKGTGKPSGPQENACHRL